MVFIGRDCVRVGDPVSSEAIQRAEWVSLESVPGMIAAGELWNAGSVVGLLQVLAEKA